MLPPAPEWRVHSACLDAPVELFFSDEPDDIAAAKAVCAVCPVRDECLADAYEAADHMALDEVEGVWGGLTKEERAQNRLSTDRHDRETA